MTPITTENRITGLIVGSVTQRSRCGAPRAVEIGGLVEVLRHIEDGREEDDHVVAHAPDPEQHERRLRPARRLEPERPLDPDFLEQDVHRARRRVEDVDEAKRRGDRRRQRRQIEDRPEETGAAPRAREHQRNPEGEQTCSGTDTPIIQSVFFTAGPTWGSSLNR